MNSLSDIVLLGTTLRVDTATPGIVAVVLALCTVLGFTCRESLRASNTARTAFLLLVSGALAQSLAGELILYLAGGAVLAYAMLALSLAGPARLTRFHALAAAILIVAGDLALLELAMLLAKSSPGLDYGTAGSALQATSKSALAQFCLALGFGSRPALIALCLPEGRSSAANIATLPGWVLLGVTSTIGAIRLFCVEGFGASCAESGLSALWWVPLLAIIAWQLPRSLPVFLRILRGAGTKASWLRDAVQDRLGRSMRHLFHSLSASISIVERQLTLWPVAMSVLLLLIIACALALSFMGGIAMPVAAHAAGSGAHGLRLPATFTGTLPCADCEGIAWHLDLWPDQAFHLRRTWLGRNDAAGGPARQDQLGRWYGRPNDGDVLVLSGTGGAPIQWQIRAPDRLRLLARDGQPVESELNYELASSGTLNETDIEDVFLGGMMTYLADAALFEDCLTGHRYPIAQEGGYLALERAYLADRSKPGAPLYVHVDGSLLMRPAMEGPDRRSLVVKRFVRTRPGIRCERQRANAELTNTYWRIDRLRDEAIDGLPERREPHLILRAGDDGRFSATLGCNRLMGGYLVEGASLTFTAGPSTMMACPPPIDRQERLVIEVLRSARSFRINGETLTLRDESDAVVALFTAVYLP